MVTRNRRVTKRSLIAVLGVLLLISAFLSSYAWPAAAVGASPASSILPSAATTGFLAAYARGDEVLADSLASPLYRAEWERRGLSAEERTHIALPGHRSGEPFQQRLYFTFVGGVSDARGFGKLLFIARPARAVPTPLVTAWRVDVDLEGKVIWLELVWLFGEGVQSTRPILDPAELSSVPLPPATCCARPIFGVASVDGREAYYAYGLWTKASDSSAGGYPAVVGFYAVDSDGEIRPGAWTFGADGNGPPVYGEIRPAPRDWQLEAEDRAVLDAYLESLG